VSEGFMADATSVLMAYMGQNQMRMDFKYGRLAVGLEVVSLIRTLESIPVVNVNEREGTVATLHTLLREQGLEDAYELYDGLAKWRQVTFVSDRAPSQPTNGGAGGQLGADRRASVSADGASSARAVLEQETARGDRPHERLWERPNLEQDAEPRDVQLELPYEAGEGTSSE